jgi:hypothetical protein
MAIEPVQLLDLPYGTGIERIDLEEAAPLEAKGSLVRHPTRVRPQYFDGRFLTADDLTADQTYVRVRQAELGVAIGTGVGEGLSVGLVGNSRTRLRIGNGFGITPGGEVVLLEKAAEVDVADIPQIERLDVELGLRVLPTSPASGLDGLYVLALRAVEFSTKPTAAYPTRLTGPRTIEDGEVVEAVAVTLIPWTDRGTAQLRRARLARDIFVSGFDGGFPVGALPIAMLTFDAGAITEVDTWMVRREIGAERGGLFGFGMTRRSLAEAYLRQYGAHLQSEMTRRLPNTIRTATDHFQALPPVGQLPKDCLDGAALTQRFFPPDMRVSMALIPEDELASLVEERLLLPPVDLLASSEVLASTAIDILIPVPRQELRAKLAQLEGSDARVDMKNTTPRPVLRNTPLLTLQSLRARRFAVATEDGGTQLESPWSAILGAAPPLVWYARRPTFRSSDLHLAERLVVPTDESAPTPAIDSDGDRLSNTLENTLGTNPFVPDTDYGGMLDGDEFDLGRNPLNPADDTSSSSGPGDLDGDGLSDALEALMGTNPNNPDTDGGGVHDGMEVARSSNPLDPGDDVVNSIAQAKVFTIVVEPDIGDPFKLLLRDLIPDRFRADLKRLMAGAALSGNERLRAAAWGELREQRELDPEIWEAFRARYSRPDAGKGIGGAVLPDELAEASRFDRLAKLGAAGAVDVALRSASSEDRAAARELLRAWSAGEVSDDKVRAAAERLVRRTS